MKLNRRGLIIGLFAVALVPLARATTIPAVNTLAGLNPGDSYQFVFVTNATTGNSSSLSTYNTFVQNAANAASIGSGIGVTWKAVLSTGGSPNRAIDNAPVSATTKVYLLNGTMVADGATHPFYSPAENQDHLAAISLTEVLTTITGNVWSGGNSNGAESGSGLVGGSSPVIGDLAGILACRCTGGWARATNGASTGSQHVYALSSVFTVPTVPEPSTFGMAGLAIGALVLLKWRKPVV